MRVSRSFQFAQRFALYQGTTLVVPKGAERVEALESS
jgi:hypothetical protein